MQGSTTVAVRRNDCYLRARRVSVGGVMGTLGAILALPGADIGA